MTSQKDTHFTQDNIGDAGTDSEDKSTHPIQPKPDSPPASTSKKKTCTTCRMCLEIATFVVEVFALFGLMAYAGLTYKMWREMREQTRIQRQTGINTERAWLGLDTDLPIKISMLKIGPLRFEAIATYRIKNFGHGPAFKIASTEWIPANAEEMEKLWVNNVCKGPMDFTEGTVPVEGIPQPPPMGRILFPGGVLERPIGEPNAPFVGASSPNLKFLWFIGCITYKDQFGTSHWTRFCMLSPEVGPVRFDEDVPLHFFGMYNDTDDDTEQKKQDR